MKIIPSIVILILSTLLIFKSCEKPKTIEKTITKTIYKKNDSIIYVIQKKRDNLKKELDSVASEIQTKIDTSSDFVDYLNERFEVQTAHTIDTTLRVKIANEMVQKDVINAHLKLYKNHLALEEQKSSVLSNQIGLLQVDIKNAEIIAREREKELKTRHRRNLLLGVGVGIIGGILIAK